MIDWKRKLTSRKLWIAVSGFVAGLIVILGGSQEEADTIGGSILSGAAILGYMFGEGLADGANGNSDRRQISPQSALEHTNNHKEEQL